VTSAELPNGGAVAARPRGFVRLRGPEAEGYLQRMVSNDVGRLRPGESCDAMLLTPKARVIALLRVQRLGEEDFVLLTEPELAETVRAQLQRYRFAAKVEIEVERRESYLLLGADAEPPEGADAVTSDDYGVPARDILDARMPDGLPRLADEELELLRIRAGTPRHGRELDDRVLPAEAGLVERAVSFDKGCYPGQEPIARLHYRGRARRGLRVLVLDAGDPPEYDAEVRHGDREVGRVTSAARQPEGGVLALAYVRAEVPAGAELAVAGRRARQVSAEPARA
jgi:tRNA-modifying protein YgfZ